MSKIVVSEAGLILPRGEDDKDLGALAADARVTLDYVHTGGTPMSGPCAKIASIESGFSGACAATECAASANAATAGNRKTDFRVKGFSPEAGIRPGTKELRE